MTRRGGAEAHDRFVKALMEKYGEDSIPGYWGDDVTAVNCDIEV